MTTFKDSRMITLQAIQQEKLIGSNGIQQLLYFQNAKFDAAPAAQEIFVNGVQGSRLFIPEDTVVVGTAYLSAWNQTVNSAATAMVRITNFAIANDSGTVAFLTAPVVSLTAGANTLVLLEDSVNDAMAVSMIGAANTSYLVRCRLTFTATGLNANEYSNFFTATT